MLVTTTKQGVVVHMSCDVSVRYKVRVRYATVPYIRHFNRTGTTLYCTVYGGVPAGSPYEYSYLPY